MWNMYEQYKMRWKMLNLIILYRCIIIIEVTWLTFIIRHVPKGWMAGITLDLIFILASFNPAFCKYTQYQLWMHLKHSFKRIFKSYSFPWLTPNYIDVDWNNWAMFRFLFHYIYLNNLFGSRCDFSEVLF